jgi:hypothetical protein
LKKQNSPLSCTDDPDKTRAAESKTLPRMNTDFTDSRGPGIYHGSTARRDRFTRMVADQEQTTICERQPLPLICTDAADWTDCQRRQPIIFLKILFDVAETLADNLSQYGKLGMA